MAAKPKLEVIDASGLTDTDWAGINKVARAYEVGGLDAFWNELKNLGELVFQIRVAAAFFPGEIREAMKDEMAAQGITGEDLQELLRKAESPAGIQ